MLLVSSCSLILLEEDKSGDQGSGEFDGAGTEPTATVKNGL